MGVVYHGSSKHGLKKLHPKKSTHGQYLYATDDPILAAHFSGRAGDDLTYALGHYDTEETETWELVELIPGAFEKMYSNSSSIYTLPDATFRDINTGFSEVVSTESVDVAHEEKFDSVYEAMMHLEQEGKLKIYRYPDKPQNFPKDNSFIIDKLRYFMEQTNKKPGKNDFDRLICLHPELMAEINDFIKELGYPFEYKKEDLIGLYGKRVKKQLSSMIFGKDDELYIESSYESICSTFPELTGPISELYGIYNKWSELINGAKQLTR